LNIRAPFAGTPHSESIGVHQHCEEDISEENILEEDVSKTQNIRPRKETFSAHTRTSTKFELDED